MNVYKYSFALILFLPFLMSCGSEGEEEIEIGLINLSVDKNAALASNDTITITAEVLDLTLGKIEGVPLVYFADDVQLPSNLFIPTEAGTYILSARYNEVESKIQKVKVISLDDPVDELTLIYNGVPFLTTNPWSLSSKFDRQVRVGLNLFDIDNNSIPLYADGVPVNKSSGLYFDEPGIHEVYAELNGVRSNTIEIDVRAAQEFEVIEIPIVYHTYGFDAEGGKLEALTEYLNRIYNAESFAKEDALTSAINPNAANMYIRFKMVATAPEGFELTRAGVHVTPLINENRMTPIPADVNAALALHNWDPEEYINIWIFDGWEYTIDDYSDFLIFEGRGMYTPPILSGTELGGLRTFPNKIDFKDSFIGVNAGSVLEDHPDYVHTMLGYYLGLFTVNRFDCIEEADFCGDTHSYIVPPDGLPLPTGKGLSCTEYLYRTSNFMSFNLHYTNFTYDQRARMRTVLANASARPTGI